MNTLRINLFIALLFVLINLQLEMAAAQTVIINNVSSSASSGSGSSAKASVYVKTEVNGKVVTELKKESHSTSSTSVEVKIRNQAGKIETKVDHFPAKQPEPARESQLEISPTYSLPATSSIDFDNSKDTLTANSQQEKSGADQKQASKWWKVLFIGFYNFWREFVDSLKNIFIKI